MANIEDRVVGMAFDNGGFNEKVRGTIGILGQLKEAISFGGGKNGLDDISASAGRVNLNPLTAAVDGLANKFTGLKIAGAAALATIVSKATSAGLSLAKSLTIEPLTSGFKEYETGLNSVQTILANTSASGATLKDVNKTLDDLNHYADKTIYNFSEMTRNIGTFTAAGVDLDTAKDSIKGIANLAALSGSNSEQASTAMYQLSQAISAGKVGLQDWNSVVNAGMGGTVFQRALATTAEKMGTLEKGSVQLSGKMKNVKIAGESFRDSIGGPGPKWLTGEVLTETLSQLTGDMTDAELRAKGFSAEEVKAIQAQAKVALDAATKVKTFSQLIDTAKEAAGSGWASTWRIIFGDFAQAKELFTGISDVVNGFIGKNAEARNAMLKTFVDLGGRTNVIESLKNVFNALGDILKPIKEAFREIFPPKTGKDLFELSQKFREFTEGLKVSETTANNIKRTFAGVFAVFSIAKQVIGGVIGVIFDLVGAFFKGSGGVLNFTGGLGDFLVALDKSLKEGKGLTKFFEGIGAILVVPVKLLVAVRNAILGLFDGWDEKDAEELNKNLGGLGDKLGPVGDKLKDFGRRLADTFSNIKQKLAPGVSAIGEAFSKIPEAIGKAFGGANYDDILSGIQTGLFGGIVLMVRNFTKNGIFGSGGAGFLEQATEAMGALTGKLQAMQNNVNADTLRKIAIAVGLLTASMIALSLVKAEDLKKGLIAMGAGIAQLVLAMKALIVISDTDGFYKVPFIAASMVMLAGAIDLLAIAVAAMGRLSWTELIKGLAGVGVLLTGLTTAAAPLAAAGPGLFTAGAGITALAIGLRIMADAIKAFGDMDLSTIAKGLGSITAALILISGAVTTMPPNMPAIGAGLLLIGIGLNSLASAVKTFGSMDLKTIGLGLGAIAASMVVVGAAVAKMPPNLAVQGAGLVLISVGIRLLANAIAAMGNMDLGQLVKGLAGMAGALTILSYATNSMTKALPGAAAALVVSAAMIALATAVRIMGSAPLKTVAVGLGTFGAALFGFAKLAPVLAPLGAAILPLSVALLGLGAAIGIAAAGIGVLASGLAALSVAGPAGIGILVASVGSLIALLPQMAIKMAESLVNMLGKLAEKAPEFAASMGRIFVAMINAIATAVPKMAAAFTAIITSFLKVLVDNAPRIIAAGFKLLEDFLSGLISNIGSVTSKVVEVIVRFLGAVTEQLPRLIAAGADALVAFLKGIANNLAKVVTAVVQVITSFLKAIADNIKKIFDAGVNLIVKLVEGIGSAIGKLITEGGRAIIKFVEGIGSKGAEVVRAGVASITKFIRAIAEEVPKLANEGARAVIKFIDGITKAIRDNDDELVRSATDLGSAIVDGLAKGLVGVAGMLADKLLGPVKGAYDKVKGFLGINSPSKAFQFIGTNVVLGLAKGLDDTQAVAYSSMEDTAGGMLTTLERTLRAVPDIVDESFDSAPVITPVLDLTNVQRNAQKLSDMTNVVPITAAASFGQAASISSEKRAIDEADATRAATQTEDLRPIELTQNNYSPKALDAVEVYRQSNNLVSRTKDIRRRKTG